MEELAQWYLMGSNAPAHLDSWERTASLEVNANLILVEMEEHVTT